MTAPQDPFRPEQSGPPTNPHGSSGDPGTASGSPASGGPAYGGSGYGGSGYGGSGGQGYGAPAYGGGSAYGSAPTRGTSNGLGIAALVLGVLALATGLFVIGGLLGLVAIVLGVLGRRKATRGEASNGGMALAGIVLGALGLLLSVLVVAGVATFLGSEEGSTLTECLQEAGSDPAAQERCRTQLEDQVGN